MTAPANAIDHHRLSYETAPDHGAVAERLKTLTPAGLRLLRRWAEEAPEFVLAVAVTRGGQSQKGYDVDLDRWSSDDPTHPNVLLRRLNPEQWITGRDRLALKNLAAMLLRRGLVRWTQDGSERRGWGGRAYYGTIQLLPAVVDAAGGIASAKMDEERERMERRAKDDAAFRHGSAELLKRLAVRVNDSRALEAQWARLFHVSIPEAGVGAILDTLGAFLLGQKHGLAMAQAEDMQLLDALHREIYKRPLPPSYDTYRLPRQVLTMEEVTRA